MLKILFRVPRSQEEFSFINDCQMKTDYRSVINDTEIKIGGTFIISWDNIDVGIFIPNIHKLTEFSNSRPIIYILKKYRVYTSYVICKMVQYLFEIKKVDRLIIQVYSNNIQMINFMKNFKIPLRGEVKEIRNIDGKLVSILFFDINLNLYVNIRSKFIE